MIENFKLKVFRVVADTLNFRRAADELHLTQPAITSQIKSLEESLGIALFDRISRDIRLTPAGTTLLQYVRQIEAISNDAVAALAPFGGQEGVEISIGASHTIAVYLLPKLLLSLQEEWPKLRIHIRGGSTNEILHALPMHQIGIALIEAPAFRPDLKIEVFGEDELTLIVRPDHCWAETFQGKVKARDSGLGRGVRNGCGATCPRIDPSVKSMAMRKAKQQCSLSRSTLAVVVISLVALVLILSIAVTSGTGQGYDQIALALPIFFVLLFLATSIGDWLQSKDFFIEPKPSRSTFHTRAPPA